MRFGRSRFYGVGRSSENSYTVENAMDALLPKLGEALDDAERGRVWDEDALPRQLQVHRQRHGDRCIPCGEEETGWSTL